MKINTAKRRMLEGKPALGGDVMLGSHLAAEMLSREGFDYVLVDNQHGFWDDENSALAFRSICLGSAVPMARVRQNESWAIGRLLDMGALGIVVPMVNTAEEARAAATAARYPPRGERSWGPVGAEFHGEGYGSWIDDEVLLAVQIETEQAVNCAEEILAVDGVDACWVGPSDLAKSMGVDPSTPEGAEARDAAILSVLEACRKTGKIPGIAAIGEAKRWIEHGFLFVTAGYDAWFMLNGAQETLRSHGRL